MKIHRKKIITAGILLSILFLYLAVRKVDFSEVRTLLAKTNYLYIIPAVMAFMADFSLRALRWKFLILPIKKCRYINMLSYIFIGFFSNTVLPMRAGEIIRGVALGEKEKISKSSIFATIAVERAFDAFTILLLLSMTFFIFPFPDSIKKIWIIGVLLFFIIILFFYGLIYLRSFTLGLIKKILGVLPDKINSRVIGLFDSFVSGLGILKKTHSLIAVIIISLINWGNNALIFFFIAKGMGISQINYPAALVVMAVIAIGIAIPSSPGYIGVYHYFGVLACAIIGISDKNTALSFILLVHAIQFITMIITGGFFLAREHISLIQLGKTARSEQQQN